MHVTLLDYYYYYGLQIPYRQVSSVTSCYAWVSEKAHTSGMGPPCGK